MLSTTALNKSKLMSTNAHLSKIGWQWFDGLQAALPIMDFYPVRPQGTGGREVFAARELGDAGSARSLKDMVFGIVGDRTTAVKHE